MWPIFPENSFTVVGKPPEKLKQKTNPIGDRTRARCLRSTDVTPRSQRWFNQTIHRVLHRYGYHARIPRKSSLLEGRTICYRKTMLWPIQSLLLNMGARLIMIWGCISAFGVGNIHIIDGIMDKSMYNDILRQNGKLSTIKLGTLPTYIILCSRRIMTPSIQEL